jgi:hypothetical protein
VITVFLRFLATPVRGWRHKQLPPADSRRAPSASL